MYLKQPSCKERVFFFCNFSILPHVKKCHCSVRWKNYTWFCQIYVPDFKQYSNSIVSKSNLYKTSYKWGPITFILIVVVIVHKLFNIYNVIKMGEFPHFANKWKKIHFFFIFCLCWYRVDVCSNMRFTYLFILKIIKS